MARHLGTQLLPCCSYFGVVLREPGRNTSLQAVNGLASSAITGWRGL
jgi:hypothetical protein